MRRARSDDGPLRRSESTAPADADNRTRQERGDARRHQILDAAVRLFALHGYQGTGIAALADEVGMTAPGLLYYFGTKERLLQEVVSERDVTEQVEFDDLGGSGLRALRGLGRANARHALLTRLYVRLGAENLDATDPLHEFFTHRYEDGRTFIRELVRADQRSGAIRPDIDADQIATEALATLMGMEIQWLNNPDAVDLGTRVEAYFDRLAAELAPRAVEPAPAALDAS